VVNIKQFLKRKYSFQFEAKEVKKEAWFLASRHKIMSNEICLWENDVYNPFFVMSLRYIQ